MWSPESWQEKIVEQQPPYPDTHELVRVTQELSRLPPLVSPQEVLRLRQRIADAADGKLFLLQGGDCAESFDDCNPAAINRKFQLLLQMSLVLIHGLNRPVVRVGRMAGQYAKPRSALMETVNGLSLPCYRGDLINHIAFSKSSRTPDPARLLKGYSLASLTLNYIRTVGREQFEQYCAAQYWEPEALLGGKVASGYRQSLQNIQQSFALMQQLDPDFSARLNEFFTCHEALHLHYEQALTRQLPNGQWFNLSTHLPWVGMRTARPDSAHIEYLRGIENPVAVKVGPRMSREWLLAIIKTLNPDNTKGKVTLITRFGKNKVAQCLPDLIDAIKTAGLNVTWVCDPMHGNTQLTQDGVKTRDFEAISSELSQIVDIHRSSGSILGGVHLELTGEAVTECLGGQCNIEEQDLGRNYQSLVDPRLNRNQAIELMLRLIQRSGVQASRVSPSQKQIE